MNIHTARALMSASRQKRWLDHLFPKKSRIAFRARSAAILDRCFFDTLKQLNVQHMLECGAHDAEASAVFLQNGGQLALAIEANPLTYEERTQKAASQGVIALNQGLGAAKGTLDFHIPAKNPLAGNATFKPKAGVRYTQQSVDITTLDDINIQYDFCTAPCSLWLDVEGLAYDVLQGGATVLDHPNCVALKVEVETYPFFEDQHLFHDVHSLLSTHGFSAILADHEYREQFNVLYIKDTHLDAVVPLQQKAFDQMINKSLSVQELYRLSTTKSKRLKSLKERVQTS